ncbi:hypothetical protein QTP70_016090 [Hemibagrus guttatus]|uniref:Ig-like domain-containing protein n=1 Tax=Hemibagrus guttatus TaxID=175788 RepID=A0AAE0R7X1_9TELE|nr:hypothetical protein QTP70_016090 [Hemibagrus guttatus]
MFTVIFMCLWLSLGDSMADQIEPLFNHKVVDEGDDVTLSCSYKNAGSVNNLFWDKQYPKSKPEFLFFITPSGSKTDPMPPRLSAKVDDKTKQVDLIISSAAVSDSALYYCALAPTVTGNPAALYKNFTFKLLKFNNLHPFKSGTLLGFDSHKISSRKIWIIHCTFCYTPVSDFFVLHYWISLLHRLYSAAMVNFGGGAEPQHQEVEPEPGWSGLYDPWNGRRRETFVFPQDELTYNRELSDYEDDDNWPAQQNEAGDGGEHEVWTRNPSPDRSPSPLMRGLSPIWTPPPVRSPSPLRTPSPVRRPSPLRTPSPVRRPSPLRTPSPVRRPSPLRTPSPVRRPSPLRTPSPVRRPSPLRTPSPVRRPSPLRRPPPSGNPHRSTVPLPRPHVQINPHHIVAGQQYVRATMTVPVPRQGIRRRRDEEDGNEEAPQSRRQRVDPDGEVDFIRRIVRFPVQLISIYLREL